MKAPQGRGVTDYRLLIVAAGMWAGALAQHLCGPRWGNEAVLAVLVAVGVLVILGSVAARTRIRLEWRLSAVAVAVMLIMGSGISALALEQIAADPVAGLAERRASVTALAYVVSDPRQIKIAGFAGPSRGVDLRVKIIEIDSDAFSGSVSSHVRLRAGPEWSSIALGSQVLIEGRLRAANQTEYAAQMTLRDGAAPPRVVAEPDIWWRGAARLRTGIARAVEDRPADQAALMPALVDGDDSGISESLTADFKIVGLTHLLAVSGTNLTLVVGALLAVSRRLGVRGKWLTCIGAFGIAGFVLLARTEPSVVRAAAMGAVGLVAMSANGRSRGLRALGAAIVGVLIWNPAMSISIGFALSVSATAGIIAFGPQWRDALSRWMPRWLAEMIAVPMAAQLACTPLVAAISGQVSLVAVVANLVAEPAVGPATVLGLVAGLVWLVFPLGGEVVGWIGSWCVGWIIAVARTCARFPGAEMGWGTTWLAITFLSGLCLAIALWGPAVVGRPRWGVAIGVVMAGIIVIRLPSTPWAPSQWAVAMCDVGQGDAVVLRAGASSAVVVDAGPDEAAVDDCLDELGITEIPLVVTTHFDADHVGGIAGVLSGRKVQRIWTAAVPEPAAGAQLVQRNANRRGVPVDVAPPSTRFEVGDVTAFVVSAPATAVEPNDASVVVWAEVGGLSILLTGDIGEEASRRTARMLGQVRIDVLKVAHHGSRDQDHRWLARLAPSIALISVGTENTYGHPAPQTVASLEDVGAVVLRTDRDGSIALVKEGDQVETFVEKPP